ncbi:hypothetical protein IGS75_01490 [Gluconobacter sphaericus]|uniref:phage antirepressor N-terminal domain-containing protein n=1 Tax=Gluconobacter sphaericus TaxID=574987 RepID=UPI0019228BFB|nr:phage antirepressor N-terminal domain-containing protein [Gluconobacter sphaericus]QQX91344.1 hypothetical protein IGS75_01490 [Gluconobacter sphaericus]
MKSLTTIPFHDTTLFAIAGDTPGTTLVAMKPLVESIGLEWKTQHRKMEGHHLFKTCMVIITMQLPGDSQSREHTFLPLSRLPMWLATIQPSRVPDEAIRARIIEFQNEAADALFQHFFGPMLLSTEARVFREIDAADLNARIGASRHAMRLWGKSAGAWTWKASGLPVPPKHLLTHSQRTVLDLVDNRILEEV